MMSVCVRLISSAVQVLSEVKTQDKSPCVVADSKKSISSVIMCCCPL